MVRPKLSITSPKKLVCAGLHPLLSGGIESTVVGKQEVSDGYLFHLGDCMPATLVDTERSFTAYIAYKARRCADLTLL